MYIFLPPIEKLFTKLNPLASDDRICNSYFLIFTPRLAQLEFLVREVTEENQDLKETL